MKLYLDNFNVLDKKCCILEMVFVFRIFETGNVRLQKKEIIAMRVIYIELCTAWLPDCLTDKTYFFLKSNRKPCEVLASARFTSDRDFKSNWNLFLQKYAKWRILIANDTQTINGPSLPFEFQLLFLILFKFAAQARPFLRVFYRRPLMKARLQTIPCE